MSNDAQVTSDRTIPTPSEDPAQTLEASHSDQGLRCVQKVAKGLCYLSADSQDSDQTELSCAHKSLCWFCPVAAQIGFVVLNKATFEYSHSVCSLRREPTNRATQ